jgi:para-aminobenzoate synthetase/4-amino-4-deoxychorismate lyase
MQSERPDPSLGVFETLLVFDGRVQAPEAHLDRLKRSVAELYELELPAGLLGSTVQRARELTEAHRLRIDAIPDGGRLRVDFRATALAGTEAHAIVCEPVAMPGGLGSHKWADRRLLDSLAGIDRVPLLVDGDGDLLEASFANVWLLEQGKLVTPPADGRLLPGITRAMLIALGPLNGLDVRVEPVSLERARSAAQIFLTSSVRHAVGVTLHPAVEAEGAASTLARIRDLLSASSWA